MQEPEDNTITVVEPHVEGYTDPNLNDKTLGTQYIYTTEGELIPASDTTNVDLTSQPYSTVHVTETQNIHIQQVDYQYEQPYTDGAVEQVISVTESELISNSDANYVMDQTPYIPEENQGELIEQPAYTEAVVKVQEVSNEQGTVTSTEVVDPILEEKPKEDKTEAVDSQTNDQNEAAEVNDDHLDQSELQGLESNPAIEIENVDSIEEAEQSAATEEMEEVSDDVPIENEPTSKTEPESDVSTSTEDSSAIDNVAGEVEVTNPRPRGRRARAEIPLHILGHNVDKPVEALVNGKSPKPRLGVKVPYRNLTSQIVSKAEIEKEILERGVKKTQERKDKAFARTLTSRLAKKIASGEDSPPKKLLKGNVIEDVNVKNESQDGFCDSNGNEETTEKNNVIDNDSDLLAILEGDGDSEMTDVTTQPQNKESTPTDETNLKNLEREIALQQLQELPYLEPKTKYVKGNKYKLPKEPVSSSSEDNVSSSSDRTTVTKSLPNKSPLKSSSKFEEPQVKVQHLTLKTYSRKRKSSEVSATEATPSPSKKTNNVPAVQNVVTQSLASPVYITKSSRVIKKKVIWDPDDSGKTETSPQTKSSKNEVKPADLAKKSAVDVKPKTEKKVEDKPIPKKVSQVNTKASPASKPALKPKKTNKPRSEVDKLLGDEGAIKMLYDLKNSENAIEEKRTRTVISVEKTFKELAKKANLIKSDLVSTSSAETPKFLRKKGEPAISPSSSMVKVTSTPTTTVPSAVSRQKSKDSARSTPPPSPGFSYSNEVSYLIRRRSSSSISSADDTGGSFEFDDSEEFSELEDEGRPARKPSTSTPTDQNVKNPKKSSAEKEKALKRLENRLGHYETFQYKKVNKSVIIDLNTDPSTNCHFTSEVLSELTAIVNNLAKEKDCNVVLIRSKDEGVFSHGIDYTELVSDKETTRKNKAKDLARLVKEFVQSLLDFPKVLVAGIQGECNGLAVTMLPLFDIVIASDDATFSTSYASLGCTAEAGFLLTVPHVGSFGLAGELLFAGQKLTGDEAQRRGLISKLCWPEKYQETVKSTVASVAQGSRQSLESTKKHLRTYLVQSSEKSLNSMVAELIEHWTSAECQSKFANLI